MVEIIFDSHNDGILNGLPVGTEDSSNDGYTVGKLDGTNYGTLYGLPISLLYSSKDDYFTGFYRRLKNDYVVG